MNAIQLVVYRVYLSASNISTGDTATVSALISKTVDVFSKKKKIHAWIH